ncbi:MAG: DUF2752 domain-containing protein [Deltaproteobacteria bacterium]|nr:DUF2752 domain-containing protein [Deltaproteobacteria bacterium]
MNEVQSTPPAPVAPLARWGRALLLVAAVAVLVFAPVPICPTRNWLHIPCPGCGATRAFLLALQGHFAESFRMHPLAMVAAVLAVPTAIVALRGIVQTGNPPPLPRLLKGAWYVLVAALIVVWLARFAGHFGGPVAV